MKKQAFGLLEQVAIQDTKKYEADDGDLTEEQMLAIRQAVSKKSLKSVKSSILEVIDIQPSAL